MIKKILLATFLSSSFTLSADLYTDTYMSRSGIVFPHIDTGIPNHINGEVLMNKRVLYSTSVYFKGGVLTESSRDALAGIISTIKMKRLKSYYVSVIGHTADYTNEYHIVPLNAWSTFWQNLGKKTMGRDTLAASVNQRIQAVYDLLKEDSVNPLKIYTENRMNRDPISTEATTEGRILNQRVDVVLYY